MPKTGLSPVLATLAVLFVTACAQVITPTTTTGEPQVPPGFPEPIYLRASERGEAVFAIDSERSHVVIHAYRGGPLARFGHDHAIASRDVHGYVLFPGAPAAARADLYVPLASLTVDEPALRAQAGFETQPSQQDIDGTRRNMLDMVLEARTYPFAVLQVMSAADVPPAVALDAKFTLHGVTRHLRVPIEIDTSAIDTLAVRGEFSLLQTDFGIRPFAVLGGALQVQDRVDIRFVIYAHRIRPGDTDNRDR